MDIGFYGLQTGTKIEILLVLCSLKDSTLPADSALHDEAEKRQK